jgi:hypothetical protein
MTYPTSRGSEKPEKAARTVLAVAVLSMLPLMAVAQTTASFVGTVSNVRSTQLDVYSSDVRKTETFIYGAKTVIRHGQHGKVVTAAALKQNAFVRVLYNGSFVQGIKHATEIDIIGSSAGNTGL